MSGVPDTSDVSRAADAAGSSAKQAARSRPVRLLARIGIASNGLMHLLIAFLAAQIALGSGGQADQNGALAAIAAEPAGRVFLWVLVVGFAAVALWRVVSAIWGFPYIADDTKRTGKRVVSAGQAVIYAVLAVTAATTAVQGRSSGGGGGEATAGLLGLPGGQILVVAIGLGVVVGGGVMIYQGYRMAFTEDQDLAGVDRRTRRLDERTGQVGYIAKGVAIIVLGLLIGTAAVTFDPAQANGMDSALKALRDQPYGVFLLLAVAFGIACYGVFCFFDARYHRVV
ncbi:DUF1206 domain-containing protein [Pseudonocardia sp. KRD291]|uniref:DUF1206 domain-containing protein n=1 Tax=Pseudonocardia sp. KRD291 TaxID=2792007 RepID=UPI001C4A0FB0|nr:DUF1206 domain-containing protein [Pseudonocardia sp. KRD291]MBW0103679.1 DUF1206 domain-containing protein [Pseudonocardia sp. KRD291]